MQANRSYKKCYLEANFPYPYTIRALDQASLFSGKLAALLDPKLTKGRHWYDFIWYVQKKWPLNMELLENSLSRKITLSSLVSDLKKTIIETDWKEMKADVRFFLSPDEQKTIDLWNAQFFLNYLSQFKKSFY